MRPLGSKLLVSAAFLVALGLLGCGPGTTEGPASKEDAGTRTLHPDEPPLPGEDACTVVERAGLPVESAQHLDPCSRIAYETPPSGGDHWPIWAKYQTFDHPVRREMYVHNLEHGALVFSYKCDCPEALAAFATVRLALTDPVCLTTPGPTARVVVTKDPLLETPIAISAWGATYTATCVDAPSMLAFARDHLGRGPEAICADGVDAPSCD